MLRVWGAYICSGLYKDGLIFRILRYKYWTEINVVTQTEIQNKKIFTWLILNSFVFWPQ